MKFKKRLIKINLIIIVLFLISSFVNISFGEETAASKILNAVGNAGAIGLVGVLSETLQVATLGIATAINALIVGISFFGSDGHGAILGMKSIVFNEAPITKATFFSFQGEANKFAANISVMYKVIRDISIAILLFVLLYIGIRMAISTVAEEQAKYKKMLTNWAVSLLLVFALHFIMIATFAVNDTLVDVLKDVKITGSASLDSNDEKFTSSMLALVGQGLVPVTGWDEVIVYTSFTVATLSMFIVYIKRVISLGFLIVIAPLITITYSIDKIGDGRSQALDTWLKEFIYTVLIQPFHCIIYIVFVNTSIGLIGGIGDSTADSILAIASVFFMLKAEGIIKKIFGLQAESMGDTIKSGTMALAMATGIFKNSASAAGGAVSASGGKMPDMKDKRAAKNVNVPNNLSGNSESTPLEEIGQVFKDEDGKTPSERDASSRFADGLSNDNDRTQQDVLSKLAEEGPIFKDMDGIPVEEKSNQIREALQKAGSGVSKVAKKSFEGQVDYLKRYSGGKGALQGAIKLAAVGGAGALGAIAGGTLGDGNTMITTAAAASSAAKGIYGKAEKHSNEKKLEENKEVFEEAYREYAEEYRRNNAGRVVSEKEIMQSVINMSQTNGEYDEDYKLEMYSMVQDLIDSGAVVGDSDVLKDTLSGIEENAEQESEE